MSLRASNLPTTRPSLTLDFSKSRRLDPRITFTRASSGTVTNSSGQIVTVPANVPRFDHDPTTGESLGLLVEESRTNLLLRSEEFNTTWVRIRSGVTADATASPSGAITADKLIEDTTAGNSHIAIQSVSVSSGSFTYSVYAKKGERNGVALRAVSADASELFVAWFNLDTGAIYYSEGAPLGLVASSRNVGNGWYRCIITGSFALANTASFAVAIGDTSVSATAASNPSYTGDGTSGIYIWGADLQAASTPGSYIPTTTAAVTRSADVASITGTAFSGWYRQDEGTVFSAFSIPTSTTTGGARVYTISNNGATTQAWLRLQGGTNRLYEVTDSSTQQAFLSAGAFSAGVLYRGAVALKTNDFGFSENGSTPTVDTSGTLGTVDRMGIGMDSSGANPFNGHIRRLTFWPQRLANSTLQSITS